MAQLPNFTSKVFLAPMAGVSDPALRIMCKKMGAGLVVTELTSVNAIVAKHEQLESQSKNITEFIETRGNMDSVTSSFEIFYGHNKKLDDVIETEEELIFNPFNPLNKEVPIRFVCDILKKYGVPDKVHNINLYRGHLFTSLIVKNQRTKIF